MKNSFTLKQLGLFMIACALAGAMSVYFVSPHTYKSSKVMANYAAENGKLVAQDQAKDTIILAERKSRHKMTVRADSLEKILTVRETQFDSLLRQIVRKSKPIITAADNKNADKWIRDYNKSLKR